MKKESIKKYLKPYSIFQKRKTTINHAFASAIAPIDSYDEKMLDKALIQLGQNPNEDLKCVYCKNKAKTWDHLVGLVKDSQLRGYGHQIGNLVPCCSDCNSKKISKDWQQYIDSAIKDKKKGDVIKAKLNVHLKRYAKPVNIENIKKKVSVEWNKYQCLKERIFKLMIKADKIADKIRKNSA